MQRPPFIGHYLDFLEEDNSCYSTSGSSELLSIGSAVGKKLGLIKFGIHIETLLPGRRTSWPHAESEEEEFAFVIEGHPHVWIDGHLHALKPGDFIAFPAGTGICHTFLNNSNGKVLLLVGGHARLEHNKILYALHPERNELMKEKGCFWEDAPIRPLGPHDGLPDKPQAIWSQKYSVNTFLVNPQKRLGLYGLLNLIQDTAWIHATQLGHGYENMLKEQTAWVLTRQKVRMDHWPAWGDEIELRTWVRPVSGIIAVRDFEIYLEGKKIGDCSTQWLILDLKTRRPADKTLVSPTDGLRANAPSYIEASKIHVRKDLTTISEFQVRNSDLDLNSHVNNTRYAQWILDSLSEETHQKFFLKEYEVNFIAETKSGDTISISSGSSSEGAWQFQGLRASDQKVVFAAMLTVIAE